MNIRATCLCIFKGKILLVKQPQNNVNRDWSLPGGKVEEGESLKKAVVREVKEETGVNVEVIRLLYISDVITNEKHIVHILFECKYISGKVGTNLKLTENEKNNNTYPEFIDLDQLKDHGFTELFILKIKSGFKDAGSYVGDKKNIGL